MVTRSTLRLAALTLSFGLPTAMSGAAITVTTAADSGAGSLRDAITQSNASVGVLDTIEFAIPGSGVHTIAIASDLDIVSDPVVIDGTTQPGYAGQPLIEVTGSGGSNGIRVTAGGTTLRGLVIHGFSTNIFLGTNGGNTVEKCYNYCPQNPVRRDQMAVFLLKTRNGSGYTPTACAGVFDDVACPSQFADWIEQLAAENITGGCSVSPPLYCPLNNNTRGQMAVFITKTFALQ